MATKGNQKLVTATSIAAAKDSFVVMVKTEWNNHITDALEKGCKNILDVYGVKTQTLVVPGAIELPFAIRAHSSSGKSADAYIALGCVIKGGTPHFEYVCQSVTQGLTSLNIQLDVPVIFGVLTISPKDESFLA